MLAVTPTQAVLQQHHLERRQRLNGHTRDAGIDLSKPKGVRGTRIVPPRAFVPDILHPVERAKRVVSRAYAISIQAIDSHCKFKRFVTARHVAMYVAKAAFYDGVRVSYTVIGKRFGGRDHTTVLHACNKVETYIKTDPDFAAHLVELVAKARGL